MQGEEGERGVLVHVSVDVIKACMMFHKLLHSECRVSYLLLRQIRRSQHFQLAFKYNDSIPQDGFILKWSAETSV